MNKDWLKVKKWRNCMQVKAFFRYCEVHPHEYFDIDLDADSKALREALEEITQCSYLPYIYINGKFSQ